MTVVASRWVRVVTGLAIVGSLLSLVFLRSYATWVLHRAPSALDLVAVGVAVVVRAVFSVLTWRTLPARLPGGRGWILAAAAVGVVGYTALCLATPPLWLVAVRLAQAGVCGVGLVTAARA